MTLMQSWEGIRRLSVCAIISASLSISIVSGALMVRNFRLDHCPQSVLWQNGWLDLDAVWGGEWSGPRHWCVRWGPRASRGRDCFGDFSLFASPCWFEWAEWRIVWRFVCEKLTIFPYGQYIIGIYVSLAFGWYSEFQGRSGGWGEMYKKYNSIPQHGVHAMPLMTSLSWPLAFGIKIHDKFGLSGEGEI